MEIVASIHFTFQTSAKPQEHKFVVYATLKNLKAAPNSLSGKSISFSYAISKAIFNIKKFRYSSLHLVKR